MNSNDLKLNELYLKAVAGDIDSTEELYKNIEKFIPYCVRKYENFKFSLEELNSEASMLFMDIISRNLYDTTRGFSLLTYFKRCLQDRVLTYKRRFKFDIVNKSKKDIELEFQSIDFHACDGIDSMEAFLEIKEDKHNLDSELFAFCFNRLTELERRVIVSHYKISSESMKDISSDLGVSRQSLDQKRYKTERKLKLRLKELQNKGEL